MMKKTATIVFLILLACVASYAQTSYQGLTPGVSTVRDVERVLGPPVRKNNPTENGEVVFEYNPPADYSKIDVRYSDGSAFAEVIRVYFKRPIARTALLRSFNLPERADATQSSDGKLHEYFGGSALLALTYASGEAGSGAARIAYFSKERFPHALNAVQGKPDVPSLNASVVSLRFYADNRNGDGQGHPEKRVYQSRLSSQSEGFGCELDLDYPPPGRRITFTIDQVMHWPDGEVMQLETRTANVSCEADWKGCKWAKSWTMMKNLRAEDKGVFRLELFINGQLAATGSFEVY